MLEGMLVAASGMEAQQAQLDAIANDVANVSTTGYHSEVVGFRDLLYQSAGAANGTTQATGDGAAASVIGRSQAEGAIQPTGRTLDVAIAGEGYLEVRQPDGTIGLTRNGALAIDASRRLTTGDGMLLVPEVKIPAGVSTGDLGIDSTGTIRAGTRKLGKLDIVTVPAPDQLLPAGNSVFTVTTASGSIRAAAGATVQQGALEASNVDLSQALTQMLDGQRAYSLDSRAIQMQDQMMQIANQIKS